MNKRKALPSGLYYFRVIVRFPLEEEICGTLESGQRLSPAQGYYRSYGVTARCLSEAALLIEKELEKHQPAGGEEDPLCSAEMFELEILDPDAIDVESENWRTHPGVHYVSGRVSYGDDDTPSDNDPAGRCAIRDKVDSEEPD